MPESAAARQPRDRPGDEPPDGLAGLISVLRGAGLDPDRAELADALWLARYSRPTTAPPEPAPDASPSPAAPSAPPVTRDAPGGPPAASPPTDTEPDTETGAGHTPGRPARAPRTGDETIGLYADPEGPGRRAADLPGDGLRVGVPEARALPGLLELERALRPLKGYRPPTRPHGSARRVLDERATAEGTARAGGLLLPAFREAPRGHVELQLLMDATPAMRVWRRLLGELTEVFTRLGTFRDIQLHYLHATPGGGPGEAGAPAVGRRFEPGEAPLRPARQLVDPTGRRLTVLVSDCAGPLWRSGAAHRLLHRLSRHGQVAVVQPLPQRLWARTRLPVTSGTLLREEGPAAAARLRFAVDGPARRDGPLRDAVPVPVLPPTAAALGAWARLLSGPGPGSVRAAVGWVRPDQAPLPPARQRAGRRSATELLARFRATASPGAARLVVYLAAAPLFLPVMQLVQRTMLPDSGPAELAEVMLSGLLRRRGEADGDDQWYEFTEGVHDELLGALAYDEALLVLKHCSEYVERRFGKAGPNFPALALAQLTGDPAPAAAAQRPGPGRVPQPFAEVAARVLRRFLPDLPASDDGRDGPQPPPAPPAPRPAEAVRQARSLAERFASDNRVRHLLEAVTLLRQAAAAQRAPGRATDPELWSELAELLLRLWHVQREAGLLDEAQQAARTAAAHPGSVRARRVLARVLHAAAGERRAAGEPRSALELLRQADREFAAVCATPGLGSAEVLPSALERADVLIEQWRLGDDAALLREAVGMLEGVVAAWPRGTPQPSSLPLTHGRLLLLIARQATDAETAWTHAWQAAASLDRGSRAQAAEGAPAPAVARTLLDLADALLLTERDWPAAREAIDRASALADGDELRAACLVRAGRLHVRRHASEGSAASLESAADVFAHASRLIPSYRPEYGELLQEWGAALLRRATLEDGRPFISQAVRVLRNCRMDTPADDPRLPGRLLMLGRALVARYRDAGDLVDLREAEYLFDRAAHGARDALTRAHAAFALGETHLMVHGHTGASERLDLAAEAHRRAAAAALHAAEDGGGEGGGPVAVAVRLAASALHQRGTACEAAGRPLAAADAYRASLAQWRRLPDGDTAGEETARRLAAVEGR